MSQDVAPQVQDRPIHTTTLAGSPRIAIDHCGEGELLLFLHGIGGNRSNWRAQLPVFGRHFTAVAWDARGYGGSDDYAGSLDFADLNADILRVLDHFKVPQVHLVGLSMGGRIAFNFAKHHAGAVRSLTACSAADRASNMTPERRRAFLESRLRPLQSGLTPANIAPAVARSLLGPNAPEDAYERLRQSMADLHRESYMKALEAVSLQDGGSDLAAIAFPTHVVAAESDPLIPCDSLREMASKIPNCVFTVIPDCGHLSNMERPDEFNAAVLGFLCSLTDRSRVVT